MNTRRFSANQRNVSKIDTTVKMVILCRQNLFKKRKWACRLYCITALYGLMIAFILAEMEVSCLEGHTAENRNQHAKHSMHRLTEVQRFFDKQNLKTELSTRWVQQFDCGAMVPDEIQQTTNSAGGDIQEHYLFCNASKIPNGQLILLRSACQYFQLVEYLRVTISISTVFAIFWTIVYHRYEAQIHKFDNTLECSDGIISKQVWVVLEVLILMIHPPWRKSMTYFFLDYQHLYFLMIIRLFYAFRVVMLHSHE